jgi:dTDP-4-dehydrorhamnose 3,5-epimerase
MGWTVRRSLAGSGTDLVIIGDTPLAGVHLIEQSPFEDERGFFARTFDAEAFSARGLEPRVSQANTSVQHRAGTVRGMHFQVEPHAEAKLVRCTRGAIFDVAVDLREASPTRRRWYGVELTAGNGVALYVPPGCAHGFQALVDDTEVLYMMSAPYVAAAASGVRWDDPALAITWPDPPSGGRIVSRRDAAWPLLGS